MHKNNSVDSYRFSSLPFYWRPLENYDLNDFPHVLPFHLSYDGSIGLIMQKAIPEVNDYLKRSYIKGAFIEGLMDKSGIGLSYAQDFLSFIGKVSDLKALSSKDILEIGCGTGYLLSRLQEYGAKVLGYEPGYPNIGKYSVEVITNFFPSEEVRDKSFDMIIAYGLLEHIENPSVLLRNISSSLKDPGVLIISVPDCEMHIQNGDFSMIIHEHFSYFTRASLVSLLQANGYEAMIVEKSSFGGSIYGAFRKRKSVRPIDLGPDDPIKYFGRINKRLEKVRSFMKANAGKTIGVYVPNRAINTLYVLKEDIDQMEVSLRFFDDSPKLYGKYFPGFRIKIEDLEDLKRKPCDAILIFSYSFAKSISDKLRMNLPSTCPIYIIEEI